MPRSRTSPRSSLPSTTTYSVNVSASPRLSGCPARVTPDERDEPVLQRRIFGDLNRGGVVAVVHLPLPPLRRHSGKRLPQHRNLLRLHRGVLCRRLREAPPMLGKAK